MPHNGAAGTHFLVPLQYVSGVNARCGLGGVKERADVDNTGYIIKFEP